MKTVTIGNSDVTAVRVGDPDRLTLVAGPCVIESPDVCRRIAERLRKIAEKLDLGLVFKASFDKANRSSVDSFRGPGLHEGLAILADLRKDFAIPVLSDIHLPDQAAPAAQVLDCLQIPAFLARQTDLIAAAAATGKPLQVKKAQFMAPEDMKNVLDKAGAHGNRNVILVERGSSFGYHRLVVDMTALPAMQALGAPVLLDATHATQTPGGLGNASGGSPHLAPVLARAAIAAGADGLFIETHPDPANARSDAASMLPLDQLEGLLILCRDLYLRLRQS
jgi:2-dehydro-3-deoxyphosphooctonate aldolase (KDO 8-P synthase)